MLKKRVTLHHLEQKTKAKEKLIVLTAYDYPSAYFLDPCEVDILLVGDSLGNVILGYQDTLPVTMEEMIPRVQAVVRGAETAMVIADMPFLSYQLNDEEALRNAGRFIKEAGAQGVKLEGTHSLSVIEKLVKIGIPVMGHLGFTPQSVHELGGYRIQGKTPQAAESILKEAKQLETAGCFSLVLELIPSELAKEITEALSIPTIGIGAGPYTSGQVLVLHDLLGLNPRTPPKFVKQYAKLGEEMQRAVRQFIQDVQSNLYPPPLP